MIPVRIEDVDRGALDALIENAVPEGKTIEYKRATPSKADSSVDSVVAAVTSFANTDGGDLLLGVKAEKGMPRELPGIEIEDWDREKLRLEHMLLNGVEPRLPRVDIRAIATATDRYVVVMVRAGAAARTRVAGARGVRGRGHPSGPAGSVRKPPSFYPSTVARQSLSGRWCSSASANASSRWSRLGYPGSGPSPRRSRAAVRCSLSSVVGARAAARLPRGLAASAARLARVAGPARSGRACRRSDRPRSRLAPTRRG